MANVQGNFAIKAKGKPGGGGLKLPRSVLYFNCQIKVLKAFTTTF